jgi:hypothetical protein
MAFMGKAIADDAVQGAAIKHFDALKLEPKWLRRGMLYILFKTKKP